MADRRDEIVAAAFRLTAEQGIEALHARTVAAEVGVHHATVHYYFRRRSDLAVAVAQEALARMQADRAKIAGDGSSKDQLETAMALAEAYSKPTSPMGRVWMGLKAAEAEMPELTPVLKELNDAWRQGHAKAAKAFPRKSLMRDADLLSAALIGAVLAGQFDPTFDASAVFDRLYASAEA